MKKTLSILLLASALAACGRPQEVRSVASAALPIATNLQVSSQSLQSRFAAQRTTIDGRNGELGLQVAMARDQSYQIEQDWKFQGDAARPKELARFRENDAQIVADPLAPVAAPAEVSISKPPAHDVAALGKVVSGLNELRNQRGTDARELFAFFKSANDKLVEIETEKATSGAGGGASSPTPR